MEKGEGKSYLERKEKKERKSVGREERKNKIK